MKNQKGEAHMKPLDWKHALNCQKCARIPKQSERPKQAMRRHLGAVMANVTRGNHIYENHKTVNAR